MNERGPSKLRFKSEAPEGFVEGTTSGHVGPKSTPGLTQKDKYKRRTVFDDETGQTSQHGLPPPDSPKSRLRFESEAIPEKSALSDKPKASTRIKSDADPTPYGLPPPPHKAKGRLRFEDDVVPDGLTYTEATPATSGQHGPKLKQKSDLRYGDKKSPQSEHLYPDDSSSTLRHDDESPAFHQDSDARPGETDTIGSDTPSAPSGSSASYSGPKPKRKANAFHGTGPKGTVGTSPGILLTGKAAASPGTTPTGKAAAFPSITPMGKTVTSPSITPTGKTAASPSTAPTGNAAASPGSVVKTKKHTAKYNKHLNKANRKASKTGTKLNNAQQKLAAQKPPKPPGSVNQLVNKAKFTTWAYAHKKIHQVEHENVGTEAAHKTELKAEGVYRGASRFVKGRIRSRPARRVRRLSKQNTRAQANHAYHKLLQNNPALRKKTLARFYHKQRLKLRYARQARQAKQGAARGVKHGGSLITRATTGIKNVAAALVKKNPKVWLVVILAFMLIFLLQSCVAMFTSIGSGLGGAVVSTSYLAEDEDIDAATVLYTEWETNLHYQIIHAERDNPDFDEYRFNIGDISHNPFELIAFLTAVYNDFTLAQVQATMYDIFNEQYQLTFTPEVEIRTRVETHTGIGTWTDIEGAVHTYTYTYTVIVEYEWHILHINLTSQSLTDIILSRMDEEQTEHFNLLMLTKGNRQYLQSPFDFNWLPYVTSLYGYRIHPISGERSRHWGLDIGLPAGTPIQSGQDGTVIFAAYSGGYGFLVVIDDGNGLVSRYAHCSVLYVSVGDIVSAGDVIARVGSTGNSTGPHLHLEIIKNGRHLNPLIFTVTNHHMALPTETDSYITINITANQSLVVPIVTNHNPPITNFTAFESYPGAPMNTEMFEALLTEAESHLGTPYVFGANGPNAFDCSSFVCWVFTHSGIYNLPRTTAQGIFNQSTPIPASEAQSGDLIFFTGTFSTTRTVTHVGIYTGDGFMIHAGSPVGYASIHTPFWQRHFYSFGRLDW